MSVGTGLQPNLKGTSGGDVVNILYGDFKVNILDIYADSYQQAAGSGDLATVKHILLKSCAPEDADMIEQLLPIELVRSVSEC